MLRSGTNGNKLTYIVSIAGAGDFTMAYYIAKLSAKVGKKVLLLDNDYKNGNRLFRTITKDDGSEIGYSDNLLCFKNILMSKQPFTKFDVVVVWNGMKIDTDLWNYADLRILMTPYDKYDIEALSKELEKDKKRLDCHMVFTGRATGRISEEEIAKELGIGQIDVYTNIGHQMLELDSGDRGAYEALVREGVQPLRGFSKPYQEVVSNAVSYIFKDMDKKTLTKMAKKVV